MISLGIAALALAIWLGLLFGNGGFWLARERDTVGIPGDPPAWPNVVAIVPARDEADVIAASIGSLAAQDYPGDFRIILVDDNSSDGTAATARSIGADGLTILPGKPLAAGWTGKLWAVSQGIEAAGAPTYLWLTDADIAHAPDTLRSLVARAEGRQLVLVSLMAKLRCDTVAERMLIPAFVFFFQTLY
ncbi:MAG: glycosyltransferase, partial [Pseudomonadota bacterium]|nr:glycosyltransferase [Pseudomonadota bacterium]